MSLSPTGLTPEGMHRPGVQATDVVALWPLLYVNGYFYWLELLKALYGVRTAAAAQETERRPDAQRAPSRDVALRSHSADSTVRAAAPAPEFAGWPTGCGGVT